MTDLTPERIEAALGKVQELEAAASPAPWNAEDFGEVHAGSGYGIGYFEGPEEDANAAYVIFARNIALPALEALVNISAILGGEHCSWCSWIGSAGAERCDCGIAVLAALVRWKEEQDA